jgi:hypothetical protein
VPPSTSNCDSTTVCPSGFHCEATYCVGDPTTAGDYYCVDGGICVPDQVPCASDVECDDRDATTIDTCVAYECPTCTGTSACEPCRGAFCSHTR